MSRTLKAISGTNKLGLNELAFLIAVFRSSSERASNGLDVVESFIEDFEEYIV
jgi:hypothetical protein